MSEKKLITYDHLEADIALNFDQEKILPKAEREAVYENAAKDILLHYGKFIDSEIRDTIFPGIDMDRINEYDFKNSTLSIFFVDTETMQEIALATERKHTPWAINIRGKEYGHPIQYAGNEMASSNKSNLIIIDKDIVEQKGGIEVHKGLESVLRHELLHALRIGSNLSPELEEGLVTYLQIKSGEVNLDIHNKLIAETNAQTNDLDLMDYILMAKEVFIEESRNSRALVFSVVHNMCKSQYQWSDETFYEALINENSPHSKELVDIMARNAGRELLDYFNLMSQFYSRQLN